MILYAYNYILHAYQIFYHFPLIFKIKIQLIQRNLKQSKRPINKFLILESRRKRA